ncbi:pentapeptide repeat-containing protein [Phycicoccus sp. MAQZ13P-2]|uniref:pentapeptide repeat-containing protein n=1 Tax=Phycicoccus mangrovi TaxID=2840470 RepID=UPI001BFFE235|nr:pentapeptide repeat-containing protein [Phycicoccus mangrovi]MBT9257070.1 pentapeptide repeat-containing protein [Phycicoccus mangrovi]MBT9275440.1 pentapeptide repeat-containing protein [Phycicoccus mangrovi]
MPPLAERLAQEDGFAADLDLTEGLAPGEVLAGAELEGCRLSGAVLERAVLRDCTFTDCTFTGCDLSMVVLDGSRFTDCRFVECKALGVVWGRAAPAPLSTRPWDLERCRLDLGSFRDAAAAGSRFVDCSMREVDLAGADLRRATLTGSDLAGATFAGTDLRDADLVGASGYVVDPMENRVRGLRVDAVAAGGILRALGLVVEG